MKEITKSIHFGWFVRALCDERGWTVAELASKAEITEQTIFRIFKLRKPQSYGRTMNGLSRAFGFTRDEFDEKWRSTPVAPSAPRKTPLTQEQLWMKLDQMASRLAEMRQTTPDKILAEALRRASMPTGDPRMKIAAKPMGPRGPRP